MDFVEIFEVVEDISEFVFVKVVGEVLNEENVVGWEVFIGYDSGGISIGGFEVGIMSVFGWVVIDGGFGIWKRMFEVFLFFGCFECFFFVY